MAAQNPLALRVLEGGAESKSGSPSLKDSLAGLQSNELVIAFSGPLGSGLQEVIRLLITKLQELDYDVHHIKLSKLIIDQSPSVAPTSSEAGGRANRYEALQTLGNMLRSSKGPDILAQLAVREISLDRTARHSGTAVSDIVPLRVAYLVDQLKNPKEAALLKAIYQDNFFLVGVLCGYSQRKQNLKAEGLSASDAEALMERDRNESSDAGTKQEMEKTLQLADFFIRNERSNSIQLSKPIGRFLRLVHGAVGITPTRHEQGMYAAYSAALGSACLSRQVGASILDREGKLIATGCNDVPRGGGGLYREGDGEKDFRCVHIEGGTCFNDKKKDSLGRDIRKLLYNGMDSALRISLLPELMRASPDLDHEGTITKIASEIADSVSIVVRTKSRLKDLIEFSRSVHAEMDALICLARTGQGGSQDATLYTTTYPCHNCARHIIAAGIKSVYFVEPYEKSLASELHSDAIEHDAEEDALMSEWNDVDRAKQRRVRFVHFEGVAPRRYLDLFTANEDRKENGKAKPWSARSAPKKVVEFLEGYIDIESRVVDHLSKIGLPGDPH